jgi:hypothetical protein
MITVNAASSIAVQGPDVTFVLEDLGGAHVSITLYIKGFEPIRHDETYQGARGSTINITPGTYPSSLLIGAYKYGALGPGYETSITADGTTIATAQGFVPPSKDADFGFKQFDLVVT